MTEYEYGLKAFIEIKHDVGSGHAANNERWESTTQAFIDVIKTAQVFVDCGAEYGFYTRLALKHGPSNVRVIAFEPDPVRYGMLDGALGDRVTVVNTALSLIAGHVTVRKPAPGVSLSFEGLLHNEGEQFTVETTSLDAYLQGPVDVIKMDIEGAETLALFGAQELLRRYHPVLFVEFHPPTTTREPLISMLIRLGYSVSADQSNIIRFGGRVILRAA